MNSADAWLSYIPKLAKGELSLDETKIALTQALTNYESPQLVNALLERNCNLQCRHCLIPAQTSTEEMSKQNDLNSILAKLVHDLSQTSTTDNGWRPSFLHEGRIIRPWHILLLSELKEQAPEVAFGLIDNGTYTQYLEQFISRSLRLDWLDISCDGTRNSHNLQRDPKGKSYNQAINGLFHARKITKSPADGGRVTSLMTLTNLNFKDVSNVARELFQPNPEALGLAYIDELHVSTMNPRQKANYKIDLNENELLTAYMNIKELQKDGLPVYFRLYNTDHLKMLSRALGETAVNDAFNSAKTYSHGILELDLEGVNVYYAPSSIWPAEGIFVDVNGTQRVAYAQSHTLEQLEKPDLAKYTVQRLSSQSSLTQAHQACVNQWSNYFMQDYLKQEADLFR